MAELKKALKNIEKKNKKFNEMLSNHTQMVQENFQILCDLIDVCYCLEQISSRSK